MTREQKVAKAKELRASGWLAREIAAAVGAPESTVRNWYLGGECENCGAHVGRPKARRCFQCERTRNAERNEEMIRRHSEGEPHWLIAEELGVSESEVRSLLDYYRRRKGRDIPMHKLGGNAEAREARREQMIRWRREGLSNSQIGERLGTSAASVVCMFQTARKLGLDVPYIRDIKQAAA